MSTFCSETKEGGKSFFFLPKITAEEETNTWDSSSHLRSALPTAWETLDKVISTLSDSVSSFVEVRVPTTQGGCESKLCRHKAST